MRFVVTRGALLPPKNEDSGQADLASDYARYGSLGMQFAATICLLVLGGYWLDEKLGTRPWFTALGALSGCVGGTISLVKKVPPPRGRPPQNS
jgi:F0F1-type ATP synthase assembly protein I